MKFSSSTETRFLHQMNVTPFIDVMLVLLVIFMISSSIVIADFQVNLPHSSAAQDRLVVDNTNSVLNVNIDSLGVIMMHSRKISKESDIKGIIEQFRGEGKSVSVVVYADSDVGYGRVMSVMDALKKNGVVKVSLATRKGSVASLD